MKLPDFLQFDPFNQLRQQMGAEELGDFVFFDPKRHLTGLELLALGKTGLPARGEDLRPLGDYTLAYKNARVLSFRLNAEGKPAGVYHLADCLKVQQWANVDKSIELQVAFEPPQGMKVCQDCLHRLRYQGFDGARSRHQDYSKRIVQAFDSQGFFEKYPHYPIEESQAPIF
ncbi:hypothetical protein R50073_13790 [Maricurvus nonylphenolicus]|uniref:hypothetical protein n=1 Tax=Maricurvus nonylphenolicus TaxID=1008307 RepID=UPI0036F3B297